MGLSPEQLGFMLVCGAGLSTGIGAGAVYNTRLIELASKEILGASLGLSAGVMLFVSFVEIFQKSFLAFENVTSDANAYLYACLSFFGGMIGLKLLNQCIHALDKSHMHHGDLDEDFVNEILEKEKRHTEDENFTSLDFNECEKSEDAEEGPGQTKVVLSLQVQPDETAGDKAEKGTNGKFSSSDNLADYTQEAGVDYESSDDNCCDGHKGHSHSPFDIEEEEADKEVRRQKKFRRLNKKLNKMGVMTAVAIAIHNFPEGLATFIATLASPTVGIALAVAIAIHNIPEGLCVSIPIYYATGDRHKAFAWGFISGLSEIVGAGLGWIFLAREITETAYGVLFGSVAGMMVGICLFELLPTAHRYDPQDKYVSNMSLVGMVIMAISLVAFMY